MGLSINICYLTASQFSRTNVLGASLVPVTSPAMGLQPGSSTGHKFPPFCNVKLRSDHKSVDFPDNSCATLAPVGTSGPVGWYRCVQSQKLRKFLANFFSPAADIAASTTMQANKHRGDFWCSSCTISVVCNQGVCYSVTGDYCLVLVDQGQCLKPMQFGGWDSAVFLGQIHFQNHIFALI